MFEKIRRQLSQEVGGSGHTKGYHHMKKVKVEPEAIVEEKTEAVMGDYIETIAEEEIIQFDVDVIEIVVEKEDVVTYIS